MLTLLNIQVSVVEIVVFQLGALLVGFVLHYFWNLRRSDDSESEIKAEQAKKDAVEWRMKYYDIVEQQHRDGDDLKQKLKTAKENEELLEEELRETKMLNQQLMLKAKESSALKELNPADYVSQLKMTQGYLQEQNQHISKLIQQVDVIEQMEKKHRDAQQMNELLRRELVELRSAIAEKEAELENIREQNEVTEELKIRLETAHEEFNNLQSQLMKVEHKLEQPTSNVLRYEELDEANEILRSELEELRQQHKVLAEDHSRLAQMLNESETKLREAIFQRQQLTRRNEFLENLNKDLQQIAERHQKLEMQMNRLSEIETTLAKLSHHTDKSHD
jgi:hypothetical protein